MFARFQASATDLLVPRGDTAQYRACVARQPINFNPRTISSFISCNARSTPA